MTEERKSKGIIIVCVRCKRERKHFGKGMCDGCYHILWRLEKYKNAPLIKCICRPECEVMIKSIDKGGKRRKFANGHNTYLRTGKNNPNFKGGFKKLKKNYDGLLFRDHPFNVGGYVRFHRIVYEMFHKCCLLPWGDVHHRDGNKKRNHPENLQGMIHDQHSSITHKGKKHKKKRIRKKCIDCGCKVTKSNYYMVDSRRCRCRKCHQKTPEVREYNKLKMREYRKKKKLESIIGA